MVRWKKPGTEFFDTSVPGQKLSRVGMDDVVCMTKEEARRHEEKVLKGNTPVEEIYDASVLQRMEQRLKEQRDLEKYR
jgi:hypothetical protein